MKTTFEHKYKIGDNIIYLLRETDDKEIIKGLNTLICKAYITNIYFTLDDCGYSKDSDLEYSINIDDSLSSQYNLKNPVSENEIFKTIKELEENLTNEFKKKHIEEIEENEDYIKQIKKDFKTL